MKLPLKLVGDAKREFSASIEDANGNDVALVYGSKDRAKAIMLAVNFHQRLFDALRQLHDDIADYVTVNHLGKPDHNRTMANASALLAEIEKDAAND